MKVGVRVCLKHALPCCQEGRARECVTTWFPRQAAKERELARAYVFLFPLSPVLALCMPSNCSAPPHFLPRSRSVHSETEALLSISFGRLP
jgi:hypothetical protein